MGFLTELDIPYEIKNVTTHPAYAAESRRFRVRVRAQRSTSMALSYPMPVWKTWPRRSKSEGSSSNPRGPFQFLQLFHADCRWSADWEVH